MSDFTNRPGRKSGKKRLKAHQRTLKKRSLHFQALKRKTGIDY